MPDIEPDPKSDDTEMQDNKPASKLKHEVERFVIQLLRDRGPMTTRDLRAALDTENVQCPDEPVRYLNRLRVKGKIQGEASVAHKGWVWWASRVID